MKTIFNIKIDKAMKLIPLIISLCWVSILGAQVGEINYISYTSSGSNESADIDNDGDLDMVSSNYMWDLNDRGLVWYENADGNGTEWISHPIFVDYDEIFGIISSNYLTVEDVTGDGWADIILGKQFTMVHNGDPDNVEFSHVLSGIPQSSETYSGDLNGDGTPDAIRLNSFGYKIYFNENQDGTFSEAYDIDDPFPNGNVNNRIPVLYDIDTDNDLDLVESVLVEDDSFFLMYYPNDGLGQFGNPIYIDQEVVTPSSKPMLLNANDFNSDNLADLIVSHESYLLTYVQQTDGTWQKDTLDSTSNLKYITFGDLDNDGDMDFTAHNRYSNLMYWYINSDGEGAFEKSTIPLFLGSQGITSGIWQGELKDFDGDGYRDFSIRGGSISGIDGIFFSKNDLVNSGTFSTPVIPISDNLNGTFGISPTDLDQDGDKDILIYSQQDEEYHYAENQDGLGDFSSPVPLLIGENIETSIVDDLDGDGDLDIIGVNNLNELIWFENQSNNIVQFSTKQIILNDVSAESIVTRDFDQDGDTDIGGKRASDGAIVWFEQAAINSFIPHLVIENVNDYLFLDFADINADGLVDFLCTNPDNQNRQFLAIVQNADQTYSESVLHNGQVTNLEVVDLNNDLDDDLFFRTSSPFQEVKLLLNTGNGLEEMVIEEVDASSATYFRVIDIDGDGKKDILSKHGWHKQLNVPNNFSVELPLFEEDILGDFQMSDLDGDGIKDFIASYQNFDALFWASNEIAEFSIIQGRAAIDNNEDCILDIGIDTLGFQDLILTFQKDSTTYYSNTNSDGYYVALLPEAGDYIANNIYPTTYWYSCTPDTLLVNVNPDNLTLLDFPAQVEFECPFVQVDIASSNLRPCIEGSINFQYCNQGTVAANNATVEILLDPFLVFNTASHPHTQTDSSYLFDVGDLDILECGTIEINVTPDCDSVEIDDVVCVETFVTPDSLCLPPNSSWDGSTIEASGICQGDSIFFELKNIGDGAMNEFRQFRIEIVNDDIVLMILVDTFLLEPEESKFISIDAEMEAMRIEADQDDEHPILTSTSTIVNECTEEEISINLIPTSNRNPFNKKLCIEITGSYDPNIKEAVPKGYGTEQYIDRNWELDYTIHFQNTGNDTAFTVVVKDPISEQLDLSTLRVGSGSHPFTWELTTQRELIFTFNNILLPDSTTNEPGSHGYFQFSINPNHDVPFGTLIQNRAAIYFDFNDPIITNQVSQTIRTPIIANSYHFDICEGVEYLGIPIFNDTLIVDSTFIVEGLQLDFIHIHAMPPSLTTIDTSILIGTIFNGIEITQDTVFEILLESSIGCDSLVLNNITATTTGIEDDLLKNAIQVFPVPTKDELLISWTADHFNPSSLSLISSNGQLLKNISIDQNALSDHQLKINLADYPQGVYWIRIDLEGGSIYRRVVKI